ncbi:MAG: AAA family ATPase, partial [Prevotella sp.]|nr:AAA family ATPase [Prevotella sp.]
MPTDEQALAINEAVAFLLDRRPLTAMVLRGAAGTGKTTLAAAIVKALLRLKQKLILLAPTGRAAKVFALYAGCPAYTIHRRIYRQKTAGGLSDFSLNDNLHRDTLFIVDEASMIAAYGGVEGTSFGSGSLLADLVHYVYQGQNCRLLLIGDHAQLPPVGEEESPALSAAVLQTLGLNVHEAWLSEVLRQSQQSGILWNATSIRRMVEDDGATTLPMIRFNGFEDIVSVSGDELIEALAGSYSRVGVDETIVVTRSNKRAVIYNNGIRNTVLDREEELCRGDQLMIVKNNYFWSERLKGDDGTIPLSFLANGDCCVVQRVRNVHELYGFRFADVTILLPDYDGLELTVTVLLDTLSTEAPALTREQQEQLFQSVMEDYADIPLKQERLKALRSDAHYNALQVKYGYAVTCHKAQGGQWAHVYIDQGYMTEDMLCPSARGG